MIGRAITLKRNGVEMLDRFMIVTIDKNRIPLSDPFFTVASGFHPKYSPKR